MNAANGGEALTQSFGRTAREFSIDLDVEAASCISRDDRSDLIDSVSHNAGGFSRFAKTFVTFTCGFSWLLRPALVRPHSVSIPGFDGVFSLSSAGGTIHNRRTSTDNRRPMNTVTFEERLRQARAVGTDAVADILAEFREFLRLSAAAAIPTTHRTRLDASDMVQETMLKANNRFETFAGVTEAELAGWLRTTLNRTIIDGLRRLQAARAESPLRVKSVEALFDRESQICQNLLEASGTSPSMKASRHETSLILAKAMSSLPDDYRRVLTLRSIEERSWAEVSSQMGRTEGSARMLWTRALVQLKPKLEAFSGGD